MDMFERFHHTGVVPVVVIDDAQNALPTAQAMAAGGIPVMEITFRTPAAPDSIRLVSENLPEVLVGAGTVTDLAQAKLAVECGAKFIVSPGYDGETVDWCLENGIPVLPGCVTPTEIMGAKKKGLSVLKFFPANVYGGLKAIKALAGPFPGMRFIPTGGVNNDNLAEFLSSPFICAVGGSWVCPRAEIAAGNYEKISELCRTTAQIVKTVRG